LVGFTTTFEQNLASLSLARRVKEHFPSIPIVFGGANCEGEMGVTLHRLFPFIDYVCSGEGDIAFPQLARQILHDRPVGDIAGFTRRLDGQTVSSQHSAPVVDMDALPLPNYDDYMVQRSGMSADASLAPQLLIETSRGCWWGEKSHCTFCGLNGLTMKFRVKSADRAFDEIMALVERYPTTRLAAVDNIMDLRYFRDLLPRLVDLGLQLDLFYETKANLRKDQVRLFREAGIGQIQPGIESLNDNVLRLMRKGVSMLQNIQLLRWCAEFMVQPGWNLLAGFPEEDPVDYAMQAQLVPLLTHLPPPIHVNLVRLDRFSPLFDKSGSNGVCNVRAARAHEYVYPFPPEELAALAYFFDFDFADERDPETYLGELRRQVEMWKDEAHRGQLTSLVDGEALVIYDTRPVARNKEYILTGPHRTIYEFFDHAHTRSDLEALLASMPAPVPTQTQIDAILAELVDAKLILQDERRFLSLAVSADYQVHYIASHLERDLPLPANTRYPLNRLYDAQADRVRSLVERELTTIAR
jgi:ribosomal peptide maturation radical SAM protein 1